MRPIIRGLSFALTLLGLVPVQAPASSPAFPPVKGFELGRYLGLWYEIARIPNSFERELVNVTATYRMKKDGSVEVVNEGRKKTPAGAYSKALGKAKLGAVADIGFLRVSFFGPFYGDYVVVDLDSSYQYALVASSRDLLWILSRTPALDAEIVARLRSKAAVLGFDTTRLVPTLQQR